MFALEQHAIFIAVAGSQAHGTARAGSDLDLRGVCVAPLPARLSLFSGFEQYEGPLYGALAALVSPRLEAHAVASHGLSIKTELVVFDIAKFLRLCVAANPNALEMLFADERDWVFDTPAWRRLHAQRQRFLTNKVPQTFLGYAMAQLKKVRTHRAWLLQPPQERPSRSDFGLPEHGVTLSRDDQNRIEQSIADKIRSYGIDEIEMPKPARIAAQERVRALYRDVLTASEEEVEARLRAVATCALSLPVGLVSALNAEKKYRAALKHWESYQTWKEARNPARAALEREHGYDTKHAMHLIRLLRMGLEVLESGKLEVRRHDAGELQAIRDGALSFDELLATATVLQEKMERAVVTTRLPQDADFTWLDALAVELMASVAPLTA